MAYGWLYRVVWACCGIGIAANSLVLYIVGTTPTHLGRFKYLLMYFAVLEVFFAIIVLLSNPFAYAYDYRLIVYSHSTISFIADTKIGKFLIGVYCSFYELWMGIVVILFVYKYIGLCRKSLAEKIDRQFYAKIVILVLYLAHFMYSMVCGIIWCLITDVPEAILEHNDRQLNRTYDRNFLVITIRDYDESFSVIGLIAAVDHVVYATLTGTVASFCGRKIWLTIKQMYHDRNQDYKSNLQIFYTLVLQAAVPFVLYQIPTCLVVIDSLLEKVPIFTNFITLWSLFISLPKAIDPFVILLLIKDYRYATFFLIQRVFKVCASFIPGKHSHIRSTMVDPTTHIGTTKTASTRVTRPETTIAPPGSLATPTTATVPPGEPDNCTNKAHLLAHTGDCSKCSASSYCSFKNGQAQCEKNKCTNGYQGDANGCTAINECKLSGLKLCRLYGTCEDRTPEMHSGEKYRCSCHKGYQLKPGPCALECEDIDECLNTTSCGPNQICQNNPGSHSCSCKPGYTPDPPSDPRNCVKIDYCAKNKCPLSTSKCVDIGSDYECECLDGFVGNRTAGCIPDDSICTKCDNRSTECRKDATYQKYKCECKLNHVRVDDFTCKPVDPCLKNNCAPEGKAECIPSSDGYTYECKCLNGFYGNGTHCYETDICKREQPCLSVENTHCVSGPDPTRNFDCECNKGYIKQVADLANPTARCYEENGYPAKNCSFCDPLAEVCADVKHDDIAPGSIKTCNCIDGYFRDKDFICKNIDECSHKTHNCDPYRAVCIDLDPARTNGTKFECQCVLGFSGAGTKDSCKNVNECENKPPLPVVCSNPHQICVDKEILYDCQCEAGYYVVDVFTCGDIDECEKGTHNCGPYTSCNNTDGSYNCTCNPGFKVSGMDASNRPTCDDVDECGFETPPCNATSENCLNTVGSYQCNCKTGFEKVNGKCEDKNECLLDSLNLCDKRTTVCKNTPGAYECPCQKGYVKSENGSNYFCENFNECLHPANFTCHPNSKCVDKLGGYDCVCEQEFRPATPVLNPSRPYCERIPVCGAPNGNVLCNGGTCVDSATEPYFRCECPASTIPYNNTKCIDQKYCDQKEFGCPIESTCQNGKCECNSGFKWKDLSIPFTLDNIKINRTCNQIDWCVDNRAKCLDKGANCKNTGPGTGECICLPGYQMIEDSCEDINECLNSTACGVMTANLTKCENTKGGYECTCLKGYKKKPNLPNEGTICENIDECKLKTDNCTTGYNNTICKDVVEGFTCECKPGYKRDQIGEDHIGEGSWIQRECVPIKYCENKESPPCDPVAHCIDHEGYAECVCPIGYVGSGIYPDGCRRTEACRKPTTHNCSAAQYEVCVDLPAPSKDLFRCDCVKGFRKVDGKCQDIDECVEETHNCLESKFQRCENRPIASFTCVCIEGYRKNQKTGECDDIDECLVPTACPSGAGDFCVDLPGSHNCSCAEFYEKPKSCPPESYNKCKCVPKDVCADKKFCGPNTSCDGLGSDAVCTCLDGFTVTPPKTPKDNGCEEVTDLCVKLPCKADQTCSIIAGVDRQCACNNGSLILDPNTQECVVSPCDKKTQDGKQFCTGGVCTVLSDGSAACTCPLGFENKNAGTPEEFCSEIDICKCGEKPYPCPDSPECKDPKRMLCGRAGINASCTCLSHFKLNTETGKCDETDPCTPNPCVNAVFCISNQENGVNVSANCICVDGQKYNYELKKCERDPVYCGKCGLIPNAECNNATEPVAKCECKDGFRMNADGTKCLAIDPCEYLEMQGTPKVCDIPNEEPKTDFLTQKCQCSCKKGFQRIKNTGQCDDIDECLTSPCYQNRSAPDCVNTVGSYECTCRNGDPEWRVKDGECEMIDRCPKSGCDETTTICQSPTGECVCLVNKGYSKQTNATHCEHVNACFEKTYDCPKYSVCVDALPNYRCDCLPGYMKVENETHSSGFICLNANECLEFPCPTGSNCSDTEGSYECICLPPLIQKNSKECQKNSTECACPDNSHCLTVIGSGDVVVDTQCHCNNGFKMVNGKCEDIDECKEDPCGLHANCTNAIGSYKCDCLPPYQGTGKEDCKPIDYCNPSPCPDKAACASYLEKQQNGEFFMCTCTLTGFKYNTDSNICEDVDECILCPDPVHCPCPTNSTKCLNTQGSYECKCPAGYTYNKITNSCIDDNECLLGEFKNKCPQEIGNCKNLDGSWACLCNKGFKNDPKDNQTCIVDPICGTPVDTCDPLKSICRELGKGEFTCDCKTGYQPDPTSKNKCIDKDECALKEHNCLNLVEKCVNKEGSYECICSVGYEANKEKIDPISKRPACEPLVKCEKECPIHSSCYALRNNTSQCLCHDNYVMIKTEKGDDACMMRGCNNATDCPPNSVCLVVSEEIHKNNSALQVGTHACFCRQPFVMDETKRVCKVPENICNMTTCPVGHRCLKTNVAPGFDCVCEELNKCKNVSCDDMACLGNEVCRLVPPEYPIAASCVCKPGYHGTPCREIDPCLIIEGTCSGHAKCLNGTCECNAGYYGNGTYCANCNECTDRDLDGKFIHDCDPLATCHDTDGSYFCKCKEGYTGTGKNGECKDIDECETNVDKCDRQTTECGNLNGTYECKCLDGYRNSTNPFITCQNINECRENVTICGIHTCADLTPGYECKCNVGFEHKGSDKSLCDNVDECETNKHDCDRNAFCTDTEGSYTCSCKNGYVGNGRTCAVIDICADEQLHNCSKNTTRCQMKWDIPTHVCQCLDGFEPPKQVGAYSNCIDKNECIDGSVKWDSKTTSCKNTVGSYELSCNSGYVNVHENASIHNVDCQPRDECAEDPSYQLTLDKIAELQIAGTVIKETDWLDIMVPPQKLDSGYRYCYEVAKNKWQFGLTAVVLPLCQDEEPSLKFVKPGRILNGSDLPAVNGFSCTCLAAWREKEIFDEENFGFSCEDPLCHCPPEFVCQRGSCECPPGLIKYLDESVGKTTCVERECTNSTSKPSEIENNGKSHLVICQNERWSALPGYRLIKDPKTNQIMDVQDIDECSENPSLCCSASANCTGPLCVSCRNTPGAYECVVQGASANETGYCDADRIKKDTCQCTELKCTDHQSWYWSCVAECRTVLMYDFSKYSNREVCTRFSAANNEAVYLTVPSLKNMYERICASKMEISNKYGCLYDTTSEDLTKSPVFNYWGPCLTASSIEKVQCTSGAAKNISSAVFCPLDVSQDYPLQIPVSQPIGVNSYPKPRSCDSFNIDFFKIGAWRIMEGSSSAAIIDLKPK